MSLLVKFVSKISELQIDADKDFQAMGIYNLKEIVAGMQKGDLICSNGIQLAILSPGPKGSELLTKGTKWPPVWGFPDSGGS